MKSLFIIQMLVTVVSLAYAEEISFKEFRERLDRAAVSQCADRFIELLNDTEGSQHWTFGAGIGPQNADSDQCLIVEAFFRTNGFADANNIVCTVKDAGKWGGAFSANPNDTHAIIGLLRDPRPAKRLIALKRLEKVSNLDAEVIRCIESLCESDDYVQILPHPVRSTDGLPPPPDLFETDVEFPLRKLARRLLSGKGVSVKYDSGSEAADGIRHFAETWTENVSRREDIQEAIAFLDPEGNGAKAIRRLSDEDGCRPVYKVFRQELLRFNR